VAAVVVVAASHEVVVMHERCMHTSLRHVDIVLIKIVLQSTKYMMHAPIQHSNSCTRGALNACMQDSIQQCQRDATDVFEDDDKPSMCWSPTVASQAALVCATRPTVQGSCMHVLVAASLSSYPISQLLSNHVLQHGLGLRCCHTPRLASQAPAQLLSLTLWPIAAAQAR
jgi:hypothetical protein